MFKFFTFLSLLFFANILAMDFIPDTQASILDKEKLIQQLISSIKQYKYEETEKLIQDHPALLKQTFTYRDRRGFYESMTPLHLAAYTDNCNAMQLIIKQLPCLIHACTEYKQTPLHCVIKVRSAEVLLKNGALIDAKDQRNHTPLFHALFNDRLYTFSSYNKELATYLISHGANVDELSDVYFQERLLHKAVEKNLTPQIATLLLQHGANPELKDKNGRTPFKLARLYGRKVELFEKVGIRTLYVSCPEEDPYELLKEDASYFKQLTQKSTSPKIKIAEKALATLFAQCREQEKKISFADDRNTKKISLLNDNSHIQPPYYCKYYLLKYVTLLDLEEWIGKEGIEYVQHYFKEICQKSIENIGTVWSLKFLISSYPFVFYYDKKTAFTLVKYIIEKPQNIDLLSFLKVNITDIDEKGNSLLHYAALNNNSDAIAWLINHQIDCSIKNKEQKTAIDYIALNNDKDCQNTFFFTFHRRFIHRELSENEEELVIPKDFCNTTYLFSKNRTLFFKTLHKRPDKCLFFLERGTYVNYKDKQGISPLASLIKKAHLPWKKRPSDTKYLIRLLLEHNAVVEKKTIEEVQDSYIKKLLQKSYDLQKCCVCFEHPANLSNIACPNKHSEFLCQACYNNICQQNCPICRTPLNEHFT